MTARQTVMLLALASVWGLSFLFNAVAVESFGPIGLAFARALLATAVLAAIFPKDLLRAGRRARAYAALGVVGVAVPWALICFAQLTLPANVAAILNASTPLFGALVGVAWLGERLTSGAVAGMVTGLVGVGLVVGLTPVDIDALFLLSAAASLGAGLCYGIASHATRRWFADDPPATVTLGQMVAGGLLLAPALSTTAAQDLEPIDLQAVGAVVGLAVLCTAIAYLLFMRLIAETGATKALTVTMLVPVAGAIWAFVFLGETLTPLQIAGAALVVGSVRLVNGRPVQQPLRATPLAEGERTSSVPSS